MKKKYPKRKHLTSLFIYISHITMNVDKFFFQNDAFHLTFKTDYISKKYRPNFVMTKDAFKSCTTPFNRMQKVINYIFTKPQRIYIVCNLIFLSNLFCLENTMVKRQFYTPVWSKYCVVFNFANEDA